MRPVLIAVGVAGLLLGMVDPTPAHIGDRIFPVFELTDQDLAYIDVRDGSVGDWLEVVGEPTLTALELHGSGPWGGAIHPADLDVRIWLAWHDATNRIFLAMERADDDYVNKLDRTAGVVQSIYLWDGSILFDVDGDHSGGPACWFPDLEVEEQQLLWHQQAQRYEAIAEVFDEGPQINVMLPYDSDPFFLSPPYADAGGAAFSDQPAITVTELYVTPFDLLVWNSPEESRISELYPGKVVGLGFDIPDVDGVPFSDQAFIKLYTGVGAGCNASRLCDAVLLGPGGGIPDVSAVENITWGRIKAQFVE